MVRMPQRHETVIAWQRADDLCVAIYQLTQARFPNHEQFGLTAQVRRAAYSVAANLVEGFAFESGAARLRFFRIAVGSLAEVGYGVHLATRLGYLKSDDSRAIQLRIQQTAAPLHGLVRQLKGARTTP